MPTINCARGAATALGHRLEAGAALGTSVITVWCRDVFARRLCRAAWVRPAALARRTSTCPKGPQHRSVAQLPLLAARRCRSVLKLPLVEAQRCRLVAQLPRPPVARPR